MSTSEIKRRRGWYRLEVVVFVFMLLSLWATLALYSSDYLGSLHDNAFIYLRYLDTLYSGCGLRFHCSQAPVEGFWSPLYLGLLALGSLFSDGQNTMEWLGLLSITATLTGALWTFRKVHWHRQNHLARIVLTISVALLFMYDHLILHNMVNGTETALTCLVVGFVFYSAQQPKQPYLSYALLLATWCRPEAWMLCLVAPQFFPQARTRAFWQPLLIGTGLLVLVRWLLLGSWVPNPFWTSSFGTLKHLQLGGASILQICIDFPFVLLAPFALLIPKMRKATGYILSSSALWLGSYLLTGGEPTLHSSLAMPILIPLTCLGVLGALSALEELEDRLPKWAPMLLPWSVPVAAITLLLILWPTHTFPREERIRTIQHQKWLSEYLAAQYPKQLIATTTPGILGYYSKLPILDLRGTTAVNIRKGHPLSFHTLQRSELGHERINIHWIQTHKPKIIVLPMAKKKAPSSLKDLVPRNYVEHQLIDSIQKRRIPYVWIRVEIAPKVYRLLLLRKKRA